MVLIVSCNSDKNKETLKGNILVYNRVKNRYSIYQDSSILRKSFEVDTQYYFLKWLNRTNGFIGLEYFFDKKNKLQKTDLIELDSSGQFIKRLYEPETESTIFSFSSSKDDKYVVLLIKKNKSNLNRFDNHGLTPIVDLMVYDISSRSEVLFLEDFGTIPNLNLCESPWVFDSPTFIYSLKETKIFYPINGEEFTHQQLDSAEGLYIMNILTKERNLLVPNGFDGIASPTNSKIAYEVNNSIRVLDINEKTDKILYKYGKSEKIYTKHWTPDGKRLYFCISSPWSMSSIYKQEEKLIDVETCREIPFFGIKHGFKRYSWK